MKHKIFFLAVLAVLSSCKPKDEPISSYQSVSFECFVDGLTATFQNKSTSGIVSFLWFFGDDGQSVDKNTQHTYSSDGVYTVTLIGWEADEKTH